MVHVSYTWIYATLSILITIVIVNPAPAKVTTIPERMCGIGWSQFSQFSSRRLRLAGSANISGRYQRSRLTEWFMGTANPRGWFTNDTPGDLLRAAQRSGRYREGVSRSPDGGHLRYSRARYFEKSRSTSRCSRLGSARPRRVRGHSSPDEWFRAARYRDERRRDGGMLVENEENETGRGDGRSHRMGSPEESRPRSTSGHDAASSRPPSRSEVSGITLTVVITAVVSATNYARGGGASRYLQHTPSPE